MQELGSELIIVSRLLAMTVTQVTNPPVHSPYFAPGPTSHRASTVFTQLHSLNDSRTVPSN